MAPATYKEAGVDIEAADRFKGSLTGMVQSTHTQAVLSDMAGFCSLVALPEGLKGPVLASATDGVGTKILLAEALGRLEGLGQDLVAMCVNDLVTCGARPLFFLDYIAVGRFDAELTALLVSSIARACTESGMALVGGETAQMPGLYGPGHFDLAGFAVGVVEREAILGPRQVRAGDVLLGLPSSGLHSNGFSLVRAVAGEDPVAIRRRSPKDFDLAVEFTRPTRLYPAAAAALLAVGGVHAMAHITGGGIPGNVVRLLPEGLRARLDTTAWVVPPIFAWIAAEGGVVHEEMLRTFNMGLGLVVAADPSRVDALLACAGEGSCAEGLRVVGEIVDGERHVELS